jgi:serine/threonine-protein kinase
VHRDTKPGNLLITPDGRVKITDFGIARIADQVPLTATGQVMGTVQYLSPEQASGHPASPSTDIYSLGIVAYEALAGRRPFTGESQVAIAMAQINEAPPDLPVTVSEPVRNLVYSCIAKRPEDRPATAAHLARAAQALRRGDVAGAAAAVPGVAAGAVALESASTAATRVMPSAPGATTTPIPETRRRSPWMWPLIAIVSLLAVALIAIIIVFAVQPNGEKEPTSPPPTSPSEPPSQTPSDEPTSDTVRINRGDFEGKPAGEATDALLALDPTFQVEIAQDSPPAPSPDKVGTVKTISPSGNVPKGSTIRLTVYGDFPAPSAPGPLSASSPTGDPGDPIILTFSKYTGCPSGYALEGYTFSLENATAIGGSDQADANATSFEIQLGSSGEAKASYVARCAGGITSQPSAQLTITVN